jgi:hypothetical protein
VEWLFGWQRSSASCCRTKIDALQRHLVEPRREMCEAHGSAICLITRGCDSPARCLRLASGDWSGASSFHTSIGRRTAARLLSLQQHRHRLSLPFKYLVHRSYTHSSTPVHTHSQISQHVHLLLHHPLPRGLRARRPSSHREAPKRHNLRQCRTHLPIHPILPQRSHLKLTLTLRPHSPTPPPKSPPP